MTNRKERDTCRVTYSEDFSTDVIRVRVVWSRERAINVIHCREETETKLSPLQEVKFNVFVRVLWCSVNFLKNKPVDTVKRFRKGNLWIHRSYSYLSRLCYRLIYTFVFNYSNFDKLNYPNPEKQVKSSILIVCNIFIKFWNREGAIVYVYSCSKCEKPEGSVCNSATKIYVWRVSES